MPGSKSSLVTKAFAVYAKDLRLELRTKYAINAILMFGVTTLAVVSFSLGQSGLEPSLLAALFWIIMFFSAISGLAQTFIREEETGTALALRLSADADPVYIGKLLFNLTLQTVVTLVVTPLFFVFTDASTDGLGGFVIVLILGTIGLCSATTLIAAIIAKAAVKGALFAVLSFPILMPLLMTLVKATEKVLAGQGVMAASAELQVLTAYAVVMVTGSVMLFKFVWQE